jgi:hypothetical protein
MPLPGPNGLTGNHRLAALVRRPALLVLRCDLKRVTSPFLRPTFDKFFVAEVEGVLQVLQAGHQANGQTRAGPQG